MDKVLKTHAEVVCKYLGLWPVSHDSYEFKIAYNAICETNNVYAAVDRVRDRLCLENPR